jgi:hypothetical protein
MIPTKETTMIRPGSLFRVLAVSENQIMPTARMCSLEIVWKAHSTLQPAVPALSASHCHQMREPAVSLSLEDAGSEYWKTSVLANGTSRRFAKRSRARLPQAPAAIQERDSVKTECCRDPVPALAPGLPTSLVVLMVIAQEHAATRHQEIAPRS